MPDQLTVRSEFHEEVVRALERAGYELMEEVDFPPYRVDIYVPDFHVAIEADGPQHSAREDSKRDRALWSAYRLPVFRARSLASLNSLREFVLTHALTKNVRWEFAEDRVPWI